MGVGLIDAQSADAFIDRFFVPAGISVAVPVFGGEGIEWNSVQGNAKILMPQGSGHFVFGGFGGDSERIALRGDRVWIVAVGELAGGVIGNSVGGDDSVVALDFDFDLRLGDLVEQEERDAL